MTRAKTYLIILAVLIGANGGAAFGAKVRTKGIDLDEQGIPLAAPKAAVDRVAYSYQKRAIEKLRRLVNNLRYASQQSTFLARLARLEQEHADITFRIAHAEAFYAKKPINLSLYKQIMRDSIRTLDQLISKYPSYPKLPYAYIMRAKAYEDIDQRQKAILDYHFVVNHYPDVQVKNSAYLGLAEFEMEALHYAKAIEYLKRVLDKKVYPDYPYALYKLAWSHFHLDDVRNAMANAKLYIDYYDDRISKFEKTESPIGSNIVLRDEMLVDATLYYARGHEKKLPEYKVETALDFFRSLANGPKGPEAIPPMLASFTKYLRAHNENSALSKWKTEVISREAGKPQSLDVLLLVYEDELSQYQYLDAVRSLEEMVKMHVEHADHYPFKKAEVVLLNSADKMQQTIAAEAKKSNHNPKTLNLVLASIYKAFLQIAPSTHAQVFKAHYNLAEALAGADKYDEAMGHYQWIITQGKKYRDRAEKAGINLASAGLKAIAIRHEDLRRKKILPETIVPKQLEQDGPQDLDPRLSQWIDWIYRVDEFGLNKDKYEKSDFYFFEANRALYHYGHIKKAVERMIAFVRKNPESKFAEPAALLVMDTMIASNAWEKAHELAQEFGTNPNWKGKEIGRRLYDVAANSFYKIGEEKFNAGDYKGVLEQNDAFEKNYGNSDRRTDWLVLVGKSAVAAKDDQRAVSTFSKLIALNPHSDHAADLILLKATNDEKGMDYGRAAEGYARYLALPMSKKRAGSAENRNLRERILLMTWLAGDQSKLRTLSEDPRNCSGIYATCDRFKALALLGMQQRRRADLDEIKKKMFTRTNRALWTLLALEGRVGLTYEERLRLLRQLVQSWGEMDALAKYSTLPVLSEVVPRTIALARAEVARGNHVKADRASIANRVAHIKRVEDVAGDVVKLPWAKVQAKVLNEVANLYFDLGQDIQRIRAPAGLKADDLKTYRDTMIQISTPFADNGKKIRGKAFEIASKSGIDDEVFQSIAKTYFSESPKESEGLLPKTGFASPSTISVRILDRIEQAAAMERTKENEGFKDAWANALKAQNWQKVAYLLQVGKDRIPPSIMGVMKAVSLASVGARAEALAELDQARNGTDLRDKERSFVTAIMIKQYLNTLSKAKVINLMEEVDEDEVQSTLSREEFVLVENWSASG